MATRLPEPATDTLELTVNGRPVATAAPPFRRLADLLREELCLTGTKIGCNAGDCGACTVLLDGEQVCACLVAVGQCAGRRVLTVEGLAADSRYQRLRDAFLAHGAAQCGICTPGMLMAAADLLARSPRPDRAEVEDALAGVLCRCTGYLKIVDAVIDAAAGTKLAGEEGAMGARIVRLDGQRKIDGTDVYGADSWPADCLVLRLVRSPNHRARFTLGDMAALPVRVLTAADIPGRNGFGIYPDLKDQPVLAQGEVRHRGEPVLALVGTQKAVAAVPDEALPIVWVPLVYCMKLFCARSFHSRRIFSS